MTDFMDFRFGGAMKIDVLPAFGGPEPEDVVFLNLRIPSGPGGPYHGHLTLDVREARRVRAALTAAIEACKVCGCWTCDVDARGMRMFVCPDCGNKRCPRATDHRLACTGSNESGQPGSRYGGL